MARGQYNGTRFLTTNFRIDSICKKTEKQDILDWQLVHCKGEENFVMYDVKSCAFVANPTMDFTCYYNYMVMLNQAYDYWSNYGLFDQGFKPLIYMPSIWRAKEVPDFLMQMATIAGVNLEKGPSISLMGVNKGAGYSDYWVPKEQFVKLIEYAENDFYERFKIEPRGKFDFGTKDPDKVRPTQLIRVYSNLERELAKGR